MNIVSDFGVMPTTGFPAIDMFLRDPLGNGIAVLVLLVMVISVVWILVSFVTGHEFYRKSAPNWAIPILALVGLGIALYMTYVETTRVQAFCGPIGDCNTVQQSRYARVFGFLPVGLLGAIGYLAILVSWLIYRYGPAPLKTWSGLALWGMALFGIIFSIYLTFLEPFVIGATCMWCIGQAIVMTLMMWVTTFLAQPLLNTATED